MRERGIWKRPGVPAEAQQLKVCQSTFALCTIAHCDPIPGSDIVTGQYTDATCTTEMISSATIPQIDRATQALKDSKLMKPFPIQVLNKK
jgi:hypothetical protein